MWKRAAYFGRYINLGCSVAVHCLGSHFNLH
nr:4-14 CRISPR MLO8 [Cucumis sativus]